LNFFKKLRTLATKICRPVFRKTSFARAKRCCQVRSLFFSALRFTDSLLNSNEFNPRKLRDAAPKNEQRSRLPDEASPPAGRQSGKETGWRRKFLSPITLFITG
jgi:hypothetical protein